MRWATHVPAIDTIGDTVPVKTILAQLGQLVAVGLTVNLIAVLVTVPVKAPVPTSGDSKLNIPLMLSPFWTIWLRAIAPDSEAVVLWALPVYDFAREGAERQPSPVGQSQSPIAGPTLSS